MRKEIVEDTVRSTRARKHPRLRRSGIRMGVAATVVTLGLVAMASPVLAHSNIITGTSSCSTIAGVVDYQVTWIVTNNWNVPESARVTFATGGVATLSQESFMIPASGNGSGGAGRMPYASVTVIQTLPQSVSGTIFLNVSNTYSDNYAISNSGEITAPTNCPSALASTPTTIPSPAVVAPATAASVSPTTIPTTVPSVAAPTTTSSAAPLAKTLELGRSTTGAKRPISLASTLPSAKPHVPITKAATFTG